MKKTYETAVSAALAAVFSGSCSQASDETDEKKAGVRDERAVKQSVERASSEVLAILATR